MPGIVTYASASNRVRDQFTNQDVDNGIGRSNEAAPVCELYQLLMSIFGARTTMLNGDEAAFLKVVTNGNVQRASSFLLGQLRYRMWSTTVMG